MSAPIRYRIHPADPNGHYFQLRLTIDEPDPDGQQFALPAWIPGSYLIREFARHIVAISASSATGNVPLTKLDKDRWRAESTDGPLCIDYRVYAHDLSVRGAWLDARRGYFNGPCVFLRVDGFTDCPVELSIEAPTHCDDWRVATSMSAQQVSAAGFGTYSAADYDELVDHPVEMGIFDLIEFEAGGVPHQMVISGRHDCDTERLAKDLAPICEAHGQRFGEWPMDRYLFLTLAVGEGYGGLEHRASSSLMIRRDHLPRRGQAGVSEGYRDFLALCSHEYLHLWHVKRIRPAAFTPYNYHRESYTEQLWVFEGITSYLDEHTVLRAGRITADNYLTLLAQTITRVQRGGGRLQQSLAESSFDAWTKFYRQDANSPNVLVSYYGKGALVALLLDLKLRLLSNGQCGIDDVMRQLWQRHGRDGVGVPENGVEQLAAELAEPWGGGDLDAFFDAAVRGTGDLPLAEVLAEFGVELQWRAASSMDDRGGCPAANPRQQTVGMKLAAANGGLRVQQVANGGPAEQAGLAPQDSIVAIDGLKASLNELESRLRLSPAGTRLRVHAFRGDELLETELVLAEAPRDTCVLRCMENVGADVGARRQQWIGA